MSDKTIDAAMGIAAGAVTMFAFVAGVAIGRGCSVERAISRSMKAVIEEPSINVFRMNRNERCLLDGLLANAAEYIRGSTQDPNAKHLT